MRIPLSTDIVTRDGTLSKDAKLVNAFIEGEEVVYKRPGIGSALVTASGVAQGGIANNLKPQVITGYIVTATFYTQTTQAGLAGFICTGAAWNGSVYCAVGTSGVGAAINYCYTSPDGNTWTIHSTIQSGAWQSIAWDGTVFCAVGQTVSGSGTWAISTSPDGITWTAQTAPVATTQSLCTSIINGNGTFVVYGQTTVGGPTHGFKVYYSIDHGVTWTNGITASGSGIGNSIGSMAYGNGIFILSVSDPAIGTGNPFYTSPTGATWTLGTNPSANTISTAWNGSIFLAIQSTGTSCYTSINGISWTTRTFPTTQATSHVASVNGVFVCTVLGSNILYVTADGANWTNTTITGAALTLQSSGCIFSGSGQIVLISQNATPSSVVSNVINATTTFTGGAMVYLANGDTVKSYGTNYLQQETFTNTPTTANLPYSFCQTPSASPITGFIYKNGYDAWFYSNKTGTNTQVKDVNFPGFHTYSMNFTSSGTVATATLAGLSISSITSLAGVATATTGVAHNLQDGDFITIYGAAGGTIQNLLLDSNNSLLTTTLTQLNGTVTAIFPVAHGYTVGQMITITGALPSDYNGSFQVATVATTNVANDTLTYIIVNATASSPAKNLVPYFPATLNSPAIPAVPVTASLANYLTASSVTQVSGKATFTTASAHGLITGQIVTVAGASNTVYTSSTFTGGVDASGLPIITVVTTTANGFGVGDTIVVTGATSGYNGTWSVGAIISAVSFTYTPASFPAASSATGSVQLYSCSYNGPKSITVTSPTTFTYQVSADALSPATGTITAAQDYSLYNGTHSIFTVPGSTTQFTYSLSGTPPATALGTLTYIWAHGLSVGDTIAASATGYTGNYQVTGISSQFITFTYAGGGGSVSGTVTGGKHTVPGIVCIDTTYYVMDDAARIWGSQLSNPLAWSGLNFVTAVIEPGKGVCLARTQNYLVAFKEWSTEMFYDAGNQNGSPLSSVQNGFQLIGCATADSVANIDGVLYFMSQTKQKGRGVYVQSGLILNPVSTPDIERVLNNSNLSTVYSWGGKIAGHIFYVLTLVDINITLAFDITVKKWYQWTSLTLGSGISVTSINLSGTTATVVTGTNHGLNDGDPVTISGANQGAYNGTFSITYISATSFSFQTVSGTATPATGTITATPYASTYFKYNRYISGLGKDLIMHETNGTMCELTTSVFQDTGNPIDVLIRTGKIDGGNSDIKRYAALDVIGNKVASNIYIRHSGDDYNTYSQYRPCYLNNIRAVVRRLGADRRRSYDLRHLDNTSLQVSFIEVEVQ